MEDISKEFNIDKNKGNEFFYEQTKIDEDLFLSTLAINQSEVKLENQAQNFLIQKLLIWHRLVMIVYLLKG